jgi:hypothetical protein
MLGLPTVTDTVIAHSDYGELNSQLFDVAPNGTQRLFTRRLPTDRQPVGQITFQLHGTGYQFAEGAPGQTRAARKRRALPAQERQCHLHRSNLEREQLPTHQIGPKRL